MNKLEMLRQFKKGEGRYAMSHRIPKDLQFPNYLKMTPEEATYEDKKVVLLDTRKPRELIIRFDTWAGISIGAQHYYGKVITYDSIRTHCDDGKMHCVSGYTPHIPGDFEELCRMDIEITRQLEEKDFALCERFSEMRQKPGDYTGCWNSLKPLVKKAKELADLHFQGWDIRVENLTSVEIWEWGYFDKIKEY